jgi:RNase P subunit RPR2
MQWMTPEALGYAGQPHCTCPHCGLNLKEQGGPQGIRVRDVYHEVLYWQCRSCGARWHRFPLGRLHKLASRYV